MRPAPYFDRLSEAYAVIDGIPDQQITLDIEQVRIADDMVSIGMNEGRYLAPTNWDALVLTPDIWLSLFPPYLDLVMPLLENWGPYGIEAFWRVEGRMTSRFEVAMAHLFNLPEEDAEDLFGMRGEEETDTGSDKQLFLARITAYLAKNGQEVTVGTGHIDQEEMREHGMALAERAAAISDEAKHAQIRSHSDEMADMSSGMQTGFAALALENEALGAETFATEAEATTVSPAKEEQSVEQAKEGPSS
jgi:hypothetical protein